MRVTYEPGGMLAIVADDGIAVLPGGLPQELIDDVWVGLDAGDGVNAVLDALSQASGTGLAGLPPFAVALLEDDAVRTAVRGDLRITAETLDGPLELTGGDTDAWSLNLIEDALSVHVRPAGERPAIASELPIASGAVLAGGVRAVFFETDPEDGAERVAPRAHGDDARDAPVPDDVVAADDGSAVSAETLLPQEIGLVPAEPPRREAPARPFDAFAVRPEEGPAEPADDVSGEEPGDETLGAQETLRDAETLGDHDGETITAAQLARLRARAQEAHEAQDAHGEFAEEPAEPQPLGDHDGETISAAQAERLRQRGELPEVPRGPGATAEVPIADGPIDAVPPHLDPAPVPRFDVPSLPSPFAPAPSFGRARLSTGEVLELDRPVIVGRRPRSSRTSGADMPRLVAVESPQNDISRNHVEIVSDGETVVVTDLHTTNGTTLLRGGSDPVRLHPGEQTLVVTGDVVDLGDGVTIAFEDLP
jgi:hypothetical protein